MRLTTHEEFANMELNETQQKLKNLGKFSDINKTLEELLIKLRKMERVILNFGSMVQQLETSHLLITVNVLYDPASILSAEEYYLKYKKYKCPSYYRRTSVVPVSEVSFK